MTQIDFYTHVEDKLGTACTLAGKAHARGLKVTVFCPDPETAHRFDRLLWTTPAGRPPMLAKSAKLLFSCSW